MLLQERVYDQNRDGGDDDDCHFDSLIRRDKVTLKRRGIPEAAALGQHDDLPQQHLNRPFGRVVDIQDGAEIGVPVAYGIEQ
ncbi:hypothetical protein D3C80_1898620 [compost metagenome]